MSWESKGDKLIQLGENVSDAEMTTEYNIHRIINY
jgi:hypothetical protein